MLFQFGPEFRFGHTVNVPPAEQGPEQVRQVRDGIRVQFQGMCHGV